MAVQCVRIWLWCSAPAFHLSVEHQPRGSGIGSYRPPGKGCISRSYILLSPPRLGSASYRQSHAAEQRTFHCRCQVPCWWRSLIAMLWDGWYLWVLNLQRWKNFLMLKMYLLIVLFCVISVLCRHYNCSEYAISKFRGVEHAFLGEKKPQFPASLADWNP